MDAAADDPPALADSGERGGNQRADRREQNGGVERRGGLVVRSARPFGPHRAGERLTGGVAGPGECEYAPPLPAANLGDDVGRGAEAIDADIPPVPGHFERAPADQAGAQQGRGRDRVKVVGEREHERRLGDRMGGVAAVAGVAGEERRVAQVLAPASAIGASSVSVAEPRHADPRPELELDAFARRLDAADDLVPRHDRQLGIGQFAVDDMQVGAADAAGFDPNPNLPRSRLGIGPLLHRPAARRAAGGPWRA